MTVPASNDTVRFIRDAVLSGRTARCKIPLGRREITGQDLAQLVGDLSDVGAADQPQRVSEIIIEGLIIKGSFPWTNRNTTLAIRFDECRFEPANKEPVVLSLGDARINSIQLRHCELIGGINAVRLSCDKEVVITHSQISGALYMHGSCIEGRLVLSHSSFGSDAAKPAILGNDCTIDGGVVVRGIRTTGMVTFENSSIGGHFDASPIETADGTYRVSQFLCNSSSAEDSALSLESVTVSGDVRLSGADITGAKKGLNLNSADIVGKLLITRFRHLLSRVTGDTALTAENATIGESVTLSETHFSGQVRFRSAHVRKMFMANRCKIDCAGSSEDVAFDAENIECDQDLALRGASVIGGQIKLEGAKLGGKFGGNGLSIVSPKRDRRGVAILALGLTTSGGFELSDCVIQGEVSLTRSEVGGPLSLKRTEIRSGFRCIQAYAATFKSDIDCESAIFEGQVRFESASIDGSFLLERVNNPKTRTGKSLAAEFVADDAQIGRNLILTGGVWSALSLERATVYRDLNVAKAKIGQENTTVPYAIKAKFIKVEGSFIADEAEFLGVLDISSCHIIHRTTFRASRIYGCRRASIIAFSAHFGDNVLLTGGQQPFRAHGCLIFSRAKFDSELRVDRCKLQCGAEMRDHRDQAQPSDAKLDDDFEVCALSLKEARLETLTLPGKTDARPTGHVDLRRAKCRTLDDSSDGWMTADPWTMIADGFVYDDLEKPAGKEASQANSKSREPIVKSRLQWLAGHRQGEMFNPQPFRQLAKVLNEKGYSYEAQLIRVEAERRLISTSRRGWSTKAFWKLIDKCSAYGTAPLRALRMLVAVWLASLPFWYYVARVMNHDGNVINGLMLQSRLNDFSSDAGTTIQKASYPQFFFPAYAADILLPVINLEQEQFWTPNTDYESTITVSNQLVCAPISFVSDLYIAAIDERHANKDSSCSYEIPLGIIAYAAYLAHVLVGTFLTSLVIISFTGMLKPKE